MLMCANDDKSVVCVHCIFTAYVFLCIVMETQESEVNRNIYTEIIKCTYDFRLLGEIKILISTSITLTVAFLV